MGKICFDFPLLGTGSMIGTNKAVLALFQSNEVMNSLAREVCQNSLDAKNKDLGPEVPVKLKFELVTINKSCYPLFDEYIEAINNCKRYWENHSLSTPEIMSMINSIEKYLEREEIPMLVMSDYNTNGLTGVNAAEGEKSFWRLLVDTEGISIKQDDTSLGSNGIGKNAPFSYSKLNLVLYNTLAKDGGRAFEGVTHLVTSQRIYNDIPRPTQSTGKYLYLEDAFTGRPILPEDNCSLANIPAFNRADNNVGTDVAVVGFNTDEYVNWEQDTTVAIIKNFTLAIMNGKLEVEIKSERYNTAISKESLKTLLFDTFKENRHLDYTRQVYETILNPDKFVSEQICEEGDLTICVKYKENYHKSVARFRSTGMLINITEDSLPNFSIVLIVNDVGEGKLSKDLRNAEPPQHTMWAGRFVKNNETLRRRVNRYLQKIKSKMQSVLDEYRIQDISMVTDAGTGDYLAAPNGEEADGEGKDGLKVNLKVTEIKKFGGKLVFDNRHPIGDTEQGTSATGTEIDGHGLLAGSHKRKRRRRKKHIKVVRPGNGTIKGVTPGEGNVRLITAKVVDYRIHYLASNKYKLYIKSPKDYDRVFVECFAGRDDSKNQDPLTIKNIKYGFSPRLEVNGEKAGPISLCEGDNNIFIEFENHEYMGITPKLSREIIIGGTIISERDVNNSEDTNSVLNEVKANEK